MRNDDDIVVLSVCFYSHCVCVFHSILVFFFHASKLCMDFVFTRIINFHFIHVLIHYRHHLDTIIMSSNYKSNFFLSTKVCMLCNAYLSVCVLILIIVLISFFYSLLLFLLFTFRHEKCQFFHF